MTTAYNEIVNAIKTAECIKEAFRMLGDKAPSEINEVFNQPDVLIGELNRAKDKIEEAILALNQ